MSTVLVNASNLHVGGGVQVAVSFICELYRLQKFDISVVCSQKVADNLPTSININEFTSFVICDIFGWGPLSNDQKKLFCGYAVCFTIFGPLYFAPKVKKNISGFAQPWIAYPSNIAYQRLSFKERLKNRIKFKIQSLFFRRHDHLIVEQNHVKDALVKIGYRSKDISVVSNCVSATYDDENQWFPIDVDLTKFTHNIVLGFIGRPYTHKNIMILSQVNEILISEFQVYCDFVFTFTEEEMEQCGFAEKKNFHSIGEIKATQCPDFYNLIDALIFPSLLECFSASPIEAMKMKTTVIASDLPFVREVCGDAAFYFEPLSPEAIAQAIFNAFSDTVLRENKRHLGSRLVSDLPTAMDRAKSYLKIIESNL